MTTIHGDSVVFETPVPTGDDLDSRVSVYLDQPHWSTFQKLAKGRAGVNKDDAAAAEQLAEWAKARRIVLPASAGHYHETTKWSNPSARYTLGLNVLNLSRGWQLRDPLAVRRAELRRLLEQQIGIDPAPPAPVITLEPEAVLRARGIPPIEAPTDFPEEMARAHVALTHATSMIDVMLDGETIESNAPTGWSDHQQEFTDWLRGEQRDTSQKRKSIDAVLLSDLRPEIAEEALAAGMTPDDLSRWLRDGWHGQVTGLPSVGLYRELFQQRHLAASTWLPNDLTDMVYLACGTAYADFAVGERHMTSFLAQSLRRLSRPVNVYPRLRDVIEPLRQRLANPS